MTDIVVNLLFFRIIIIIPRFRRFCNWAVRFKLITKDNRKAVIKMWLNNSITNFSLDCNKPLEMLAKN